MDTPMDTPVDETPKKTKKPKAPTAPSEAIQDKETASKWRDIVNHMHARLAQDGIQALVIMPSSTLKESIQQQIQVAYMAEEIGEAVKESVEESSPLTDAIEDLEKTERGTQEAVETLTEEMEKLRKAMEEEAERTRTREGLESVDTSVKAKGGLLEAIGIGGLTKMMMDTIVNRQQQQINDAPASSGSVLPSWVAPAAQGVAAVGLGAWGKNLLDKMRGRAPSTVAPGAAAPKPGGGFLSRLNPFKGGFKFSRGLGLLGPLTLGIDAFGRAQDTQARIQTAQENIADPVARDAEIGDAKKDFWSQMLGLFGGAKAGAGIGSVAGGFLGTRGRFFGALLGGAAGAIFGPEAVQNYVDENTEQFKQDMKDSGGSWWRKIALPLTSLADDVERGAKAVVIGAGKYALQAGDAILGTDSTNIRTGMDNFLAEQNKMTGASLVRDSLKASSSKAEADALRQMNQQALTGSAPIVVIQQGGNVVNAPSSSNVQGGGGTPIIIPSGNTQSSYLDSGLPRNIG